MFQFQACHNRYETILIENNIAIANIVKKIIGLILLFALTCSIGISTAHIAYSQIEVEQSNNFERHFQSLGIEGSIIIYDLNGDISYQHNPQRNKTAFLPASTYKIPNSLIALETGVINSDVDVLTWDGIERDLPQWNRDLNLRLAFKYSAVWFYQILARRIGHQKMQHYVSKIEYGNRDIGAAADIDNFWLSGELRITPQQQIDFLRRLYQNDLPFTQKNINLVKDIAIAEQTSDYTLRVKTGLTDEVGWYIGYLEQNNNVYFFATNIDAVNLEDYTVRSQVTKLCLQDLSLL